MDKEHKDTNPGIAFWIMIGVVVIAFFLVAFLTRPFAGIKPEGSPGDFVN